MFLPWEKTAQSCITSTTSTTTTPPPGGLNNNHNNRAAQKTPQHVTKTNNYDNTTMPFPADQIVDGEKLSKAARELRTQKLHTAIGAMLPTMYIETWMT